LCSVASLLVVHGVRDWVVSQALGRRLYEEARGGVERSAHISVDGASHEYALLSLLQRRDARMSAFLTAAAAVRFSHFARRAPAPALPRIGAPPVPPPRTVAGLRALLDGVEGCGAPCRERAEDWLEQAAGWGAAGIEDVVRLELSEQLVVSLALPEGGSGQQAVRERLARVDTTVVAPHDEV